MTDEPITIYEVLDAIEAVIMAADPAKREALAATIDAYAEDFPEDFHWAIGPQAPSLLYNLMMCLDGASREKGESKSRVIRLVDRKPEGTA
jgi:hypothetical protein